LVIKSSASHAVALVDCDLYVFVEIQEDVIASVSLDDIAKVRFLSFGIMKSDRRRDIGI